MTKHISDISDIIDKALEPYGAVRVKTQMVLTQISATPLPPGTTPEDLKNESSG